MEKILLETVIGSRLYGFAQPDSDWDFYRVQLDSPSSHVISDGGKNDITTVDFNSFLKQVFMGTPQALEALWSPLATMDENYLPFFSALHPNINSAAEKYAKAIKTMGTSHGKRKIEFNDLTLKSKRHAMRLAMQFSDLTFNGKFNPVLSQDRIKFIKTCSKFSKRRYNSLLQRLCPVDLEIV